MPLNLVVNDGSSFLLTLKEVNTRMNLTWKSYTHFKAYML